MRIIFALFFLCCSTVCADDHWAVGAYDCRSWGGIRLFDIQPPNEYNGKWALDVDADGNQNNWGIWQDYDKDTVIILWMENSMIELIHRDSDKYYRESSFGFGVSSDIEECHKITIKD